MADQATQSIVIGASPEAIMNVVADFPSYPEWSRAFNKAEILESGPEGRARRVRFVLDAGVIKDEYVLEYEWAGDGLSVRWELVSGRLQQSQHGSYVLEPAGALTKVTYHLSVELAIPVVGVLKRKAEEVIMDTALKELKHRVEA